MAMSSDKGLAISLSEGRGETHGLLFGEDQARYVLTVPADVANFVCANAEGAGVPFRRLGTVEGEALVIDDLLALPIQQLRHAHESWFPEFMDGRDTLAAAE
jgi:phosphoribosylformylglycinamidine synthase